MLAILEILNPKINHYAGVIQSIVEAGIALGISSRGLGSVKSNNNVSIVQEDYEMLTFDLVSDPSTHGALLRHFKSNSITEVVDPSAPRNGGGSMDELLDSICRPW
jgi:hypothetical protein